MPCIHFNHHFFSLLIVGSLNGLRQQLYLFVFLSKKASHRDVKILFGTSSAKSCLSSYSDLLCLWHFSQKHLHFI